MAKGRTRTLRDIEATRRRRALEGVGIATFVSACLTSALLMIAALIAIVLAGPGVPFGRAIAAGLAAFAISAVLVRSGACVLFRRADPRQLDEAAQVCLHGVLVIPTVTTLIAFVAAIVL